MRYLFKSKSLTFFAIAAFLVGGFFVANSAQAYTGDFKAFDGVAIGTNSYTVSSGITATYTSGTGTEGDPVNFKLTGYAPIVIPWFGQTWTTYNYVTVGIKLPTDFAGTPSVYQTGIIRNDSPYNGASYKMSTIGDGSTPLATDGAAVGYLDFSFAANSTNTKKDGLVKLQVIWNANSAPEYFTIDINGLQTGPVFIDKDKNGTFDSGELSFNTIQAAIDAATSGDTILVSGTFGNINTYTVYSVHQPITIRGVNTGDVKAKVYGTFLLYVDGATIDNLSITNKGISHPNKNAINLLGKQVTITNNDFNLGNGTGGVANGVVIWPYGSNAVSLNITNNTFTGYSLTVEGWSSTALFIAEEINATPFTGTPMSTTLVVPNEELFANGNTYINNSYDYVHQNWNGGSKWFYSKVSNSAGLSDAISNSAAGATILIATGEYTTTGQVVISKNLSIVGADKATTTIKPGSNTSGTGDVGSWILVNDGVTFNLSKVTLDGIGKEIRQGIRFNGSGTVDDVIIQNIVAPGYMGFAVVQGYNNTGPRTLTVSNSEFTNFGRVGVQADNGTGTSTVIISNNIFTGKGAGDHLDYGITVEGGANATITGNTITNCRGIASTDNSTSAAISATTYFAPGTIAIITDNIISNSTTGIAIGYDVNDTSTVVAHNNKFNMSGTQKAINSTHPTVDATNNWWGSNMESDIQDKISGTVTYSPYWLNQEMSLPSSLIEVFNGVHSTLEEAGIANNIDTCSTHPNSCSGLYFEKSIDGVKMGKITFNSTLDLTNTETQDFLTNLGTKMDMAGAGVIGLDFTGQTASTTLKGVSATIKFYGLDELGFNASSTAAEINSRLVAVDENGNALDRSSLISGSETGTYTVPVGACEVGGACYTFEIPVSHFTKYKVLEKTQVAPETNEDGDGMATINSETPEVVIASSTQPLIITITAGTNNATINYDALITNGSGVIPETIINTESADIAIPASTTVTSASTTWNGIMAAPTITTITLPPTTGQIKTLSSAIELGFSGAKLSFDKGVRILMTGQTGKRAGYTRNGEGFTEITAVCATDDQATGDALLADTECKINAANGLDLVIWTRHFTTFATYTQTTKSNGGNGGGGISFVAPCSEVTYGEWKTAINGIQYRDVIKQAPNICALTATQQSGRSRAVFLNNETVKPETPANNNSTPTKQVLGAKKYADGTLLKGTNNKIYVVKGNTLQYIPNLKELAKYRGPILKVGDDVIASFSQATVLGAKKYANGTLIKAKGDVKIYVIKDGKKVHVKSLTELKQYKGKTLTVNASELNNY